MQTHIPRIGDAANSTLTKVIGMHDVADFVVSALMQDSRGWRDVRASRADDLEGTSGGGAEDDHGHGDEG